MTITTQWVEQYPVLIVRYCGHITAQDILDHASALRHQVLAQPVYVLVDFANVATMPRNLLTLAFGSAHIVEMIKHPNTRAFAIVNARPHLRIALQTLLRHKGLHFSDDAADGMAFLQSCIQADTITQTR